MAKPILHHDIFLSYYGDDFTGSTDVMESLALNGIPTVLFLDPPDAEDIKNCRLKNGLNTYYDTNRPKAFGVAGVSRTMSPETMDQELPSIFDKISKIPSDFFQLKICSTFDSSPTIGNIGHTTEIALRYFPSNHIPMIVGAPFLNRFVIFGNLFARVRETTYRLDRHPTMSKHPSTPMNESDLRLHLGKQTNRSIHLFDIFGLDEAYGSIHSVYDNLRQNGDYILFDTLTSDHLMNIGQLLIKGKGPKTQFLVSASSVGWALSMYLQKEGVLKKPGNIIHPGIANKMMVIAGSCSPVTGNQIAHLEKLGHKGIRMDTMALISGDASREKERVIRLALASIEIGVIPIIYSARGHDDPSINETRAEMKRKGIFNAAEVLAGAQGEIAARVLPKTGKIRIAVAGGDTSGYVSRALEINALELLTPIAPGAPLTTAHSKNKAFDGLEIALKGGQNGNEKYFESILKGELLT